MLKFVVLTGRNQVQTVNVCKLLLSLTVINE